jgi:hypothetical protein
VYLDVSVDCAQTDAPGERCRARDLVDGLRDRVRYPDLQVEKERYARRRVDTLVVQLMMPRSRGLRAMLSCFVCWGECLPTALMLVSGFMLRLALEEVIKPALAPFVVSIHRSACKTRISWTFTRASGRSNILGQDGRATCVTRFLNRGCTVDS